MATKLQRPLSAATALLLAALTTVVMASSPGAADARNVPTCMGRPATVVGTPGDDTLYAGHRGVQVIFADSGDDIVFGHRGKDIICGGAGSDRVQAGPGRDRLNGGPGSDYLKGGDGLDRINGGGGRDILRGGPGSDVLSGGGGNDALYGDIQDDMLSGGAGDDLLAGGHGIDHLNGNGGDDLLRGASNRDVYVGGAGNDTANFAAVTPTGDSLGVSVNLIKGTVKGDGGRDTIASVENVIGSGFDDLFIGDSHYNHFIGGEGRDRLYGGPGPGADAATGGGGPDTCMGIRDVSDHCPDTGTARRTNAIAYIQESTAVSPVNDPGLVVLGAHDVNRNDDWNIVAVGRSFRIESQSPLAAGPGCTLEGADPIVITCTPEKGIAGYVSAWGDAGDDRIALEGGYQLTTAFFADGGPGSDVLIGTRGPDVLNGGQGGNDELYGRSGSDALVSSAPVGSLDGGADILSGGPGDDQLVTSTPCGGHDFNGGPGNDVAGFGRTQTHGVYAKISGYAVARGVSGCRPTRIRGNNEVLEGTAQDDVLIGDNRNNGLILGRGGDDILKGLGGNDRLRGNAGVDRLYGGHGVDVLQAVDGERDAVLRCSSFGTADRDAGDPKAIGCKPCPEAKRASPIRRVAGKSLVSPDAGRGPGYFCRL